MTKTICDFCNRETNKITRIKVPMPQSIDAYGGKGNLPIVHISDEIVYVEQDICDTCAKKLTKAIQIMKFIEQDD
mgnify:CR=1 FL=1